MTSGARLVDQGCVLSEIRTDPGPTHCLFDVLAASIAALSPGPRVLMLGFAGGGVLAPLRALDWSHPVEAVEWDVTGQDVFRELCSRWCGEVEIHDAEAGAWLRRSRRRFDLVFDDLSIPQDGTLTKPAVSLDELPALMRARVGAQGIALTNVLPVPGWSMKDLLAQLASPWPRAVVVHFEDWENRLLIAGTQLADARRLSRRLRSALEALGSRQLGRYSVRTLGAL